MINLKYIKGNLFTKNQNYESVVVVVFVPSWYAFMTMRGFMFESQLPMYVKKWCSGFSYSIIYERLKSSSSIVLLAWWINIHWKSTQRFLTWVVAGLKAGQIRHFTYRKLSFAKGRENKLCIHQERLNDYGIIFISLN